MRSHSSRTFRPFESRRVSLGELSAGLGYTTLSCSLPPVALHGSASGLARQAPAEASGASIACAEAGHSHRHVGPRRGNLHTLADQRGLRRFTTSFEAVEQPTQRPDIVRMDLGARQRATKPEV